MFKKSFESRRKLPIINGLLAMMMMLGTFSAAYAQGGNTQVLLPLVHAGFSEEESPNSSEVQAAGSCYGNAKNYTVPRGSTSTRTVYASRNCRDLNIKVFTTTRSSFCYVTVEAYYYKNGRKISGSGSPYNVSRAGTGEGNVRFAQWQEPITAVRDGTKMRIRIKPQPACGDTPVRIAY